MACRLVSGSFSFLLPACAPRALYSKSNTPGLPLVVPSTDQAEPLLGRHHHQALLSLQAPCCLLVESGVDVPNSHDNDGFLVSAFVVMVLAAAAATLFCFFTSGFSSGVCQFHWFASVIGIGGGGGGGGG
eukprot:2112250-Amphidinium_carterae.1